MRSQTTTHAAVAMLVFMMANAVLFGAGLIAMLLIARPDAAGWIPAVVAGALLVAAPIAWEIAPHLRARNRRALAAQPIALRTQMRVRRDD